MSDAVTAAPSADVAAPEGGTMLGGAPAAPSAPAATETAASPAGGTPEEVQAAAIAAAVEAAKPVVPEAYDFAAPEGYAVDEAGVTSLKDMAKDAGLTQEQFAKVSAFGIDRIRAAIDAPAKAWADQNAAWVAQIAKDPELGVVDGKLSPAVMTDIAPVMARYSNPELVAALAQTGAGNHPAVVKFFRAIGRDMGNAGALDFGKPAGGGAGRDNSLAGIGARMYPNMKTGA